MPTILRDGPYRFFFYSNDRIEPVHVHVQREENVAKFWLKPVRIEHSGGFSRAEIGRIQRMVEQNKAVLLKGWYEYFSK